MSWWNVGVEVLAIVELDALAQLELQRLVVDPLPGGGELALVLVGLGVAVDQGIPDIGSKNDAEAHIVEIGIDVLDHLVVGEPDRVVPLVRESRAGRNSSECDGRCQEAFRHRDSLSAGPLGRILPHAIAFSMTAAAAVKRHPSGLRRMPASAAHCRKFHPQA
jgi:hypothetical protein